jgi:hypothetical protein
MRSLRPGLLPVIMLVVIIAWALFAVLMLTGTLVSTAQISNRVTAINTIYPKIDQNLKSVPLALQTAKIAGEIGQAAKPVSPQLAQIVHDVAGIQTSVDSVLTEAGQINSSVKTIHNAVISITAVVVPIGSVLSSVDTKVQSINDSAHGINDSFGGIRDHVYDIRHRVARINDQANTVIDQARQIKDNTGELVRPLVPDILRNSYAISRSPLLLRHLGPLDLRRLNSVLGLLQGPTPDPSLVKMAKLLGLSTPGPSSPAKPLAPLTSSGSSAGGLTGLLAGGDTKSGSRDNNSNHHDRGTLPAVGGLLGSG